MGRFFWVIRFGVGGGFFLGICVKFRGCEVVGSVGLVFDVV